MLSAGIGRAAQALFAALAVLLGVLVSAPAGAAASISTAQAGAVYSYDNVAHLSLRTHASSTVLGAAGRATSGAWAEPGGMPTSRTATGVAANTGSGGFLSRLRAFNWADDTGSISLPGRRLRPNYAADGPHSTFRRGPDGSVTHYATWEPQSNPLNPAPWRMVKRIDVVGDPHFNKITGTYVDTPHVQGPSIPG